MKAYEIKNVSNSVIDVDDKSRTVKVVLNKCGVKDHDNDIIERNAFNKTINERGPKGKDLVWHLTDHNPSIKSAVGKFKELFMQGDDLVGVTDVPATTWGNDVLELYKTGHINQHSIGFRTIQREIMNEDDWNTRYVVIKEVMLYEGSAVCWGANEHTPMLSVGKSLTKEEREGEAHKTWGELCELDKTIRNWKSSEQGLELLEIKRQQLTEKLTTLLTPQRTTEPDSTQPDAKEAELVALIKQISLTL
jgi:uncharacterized protein